MTREDFIRVMEEMARKMTHAPEESEIDYEFATCMLCNWLSDASHGNENLGYKGLSDSQWSIRNYLSEELDKLENMER